MADNLGESLVVKIGLILLLALLAYGVYYIVTYFTKLG